MGIPDKEDIEFASEMNQTILTNASISAESVLTTMEILLEAGNNDSQYQTYQTYGNTERWQFWKFAMQ